MNILIVATHIHPEIFCINDFVEEFVNKEYVIAVITAVPNYPDGKFYD